MNTPNDGGPAFPFPSGPEPRGGEFHDRWEGMSLRAYFAGQFMTGLIIGTPKLAELEDYPATRFAVELADALIAELNKPTE